MEMMGQVGDLGLVTEGQATVARGKVVMEVFRVVAAEPEGIIPA